MITGADIKATLLGALDGQIGTYTFSNGQTTPAIRVEDGSDPYPEEPNVTGLEVVIDVSIDVPIELMLGGSYAQTYSHRIQLKQWDITKNTLPYLDAVSDAIADFEVLTLDRVSRQQRLTKLDNIETLSFVVSERVLTY